VFYAWRSERGHGGLGQALAWWLQALDSPQTRTALLDRR
jgi:hypothetical protein